VYGPVRTVVWQGSAGNRCPYADQRPLCCSSRRPAASRRLGLGWPRLIKVEVRDLAQEEAASTISMAREHWLRRRPQAACDKGGGSEALSLLTG